MEESVATNKKNLEFIRFIHLYTYFSIMDELEADKSENETIVTAAAAAPTDEEEDETQSYNYCCLECGKITIYSKRPPANYPLSMCLSKRCLKTRYIKDENNDDDNDYYDN